MKSAFVHSETSRNAGAFPVPGRVERSFFVNPNSARNPEGFRDALAGSPDGLAATPLNTEEQEAAKKSSEETVKEAERFSNPAIPLPLKLTGLAVLAFIIFRTGN